MNECCIRVTFNILNEKWEIIKLSEFQPGLLLRQLKYVSRLVGNAGMSLMITTLSTLLNLLLKQLKTFIEVLRNFKLIFWLITFFGKS